MARSTCPTVSAGILLGVLLDEVFADPARLHPVAGFGKLAAAAERALWRPTRRAGALHVVLTVAPPVTAAGVLGRRLACTRLAFLGYVALLTWLVTGASGLRRHARSVEQALAVGDLPAARLRVRALCGRDTSALDAVALRRAVIESVAENTSDAAVGAFVWAALAGPAGLVGYRAINTLDAMVGHRNSRYERFGFAAATLDDVANLLPARATAAFAVVLARTVGGSSTRALASWRRDARAHPSPNAGVCEASFAGALDLRLGGPIRYPYGASTRPWLGEGADPRSGDVERALALSRRIVLVAAALAAMATWRRSR